MSDNKDKVKGCVHSEDSWTNYGCGDCGDYANNNGCRGPRGRIGIKTMSNYKNPSAQLREAYNRTLKNANFRGSAPFCCGPEYNGASYVLCQECPLNKTDCEEKHDVKYWRRWWKEMTGEEDNVDNIVKTTICWVYQVVLDSAKCDANNINLRSSYVKTIFFGIPLTKLGYGSKTVFQLYEEINGVPVYTEKNPAPIVKIPNETIKAMIPVKQIVCQDI